MYEVLSLKIDKGTKEKIDKIVSLLGISREGAIHEAIYYFSDEISDFQIALERFEDPDSEWIGHEELKHALGMDN